MKRFTLLSLFTAIFTAAQAQNWPQFRGPGATGVVEGPARPVTWDASKSVNIRWKTPDSGLHTRARCLGQQGFRHHRRHQRRER